MNSIVVTVNNNHTTIELLTGSNFKRWRSNIEFALGITDIDMTLQVDEPSKPTNESSTVLKEYYAK